MQNTKNFKIAPEKIKNILIVRQHHQLGDMLCALPMFAAVRKQFPEAHITLVANPISYKILRSKSNPYIDDVLNYNKQSIFQLFRFFKSLYSKKYDIGIVPSTVSISRTSHIINFISGAKLRVGVESVDGRFNKSSFLLGVRKKFLWAGKEIHQTERNLDISRLIDCDISSDEKKNVRLFLDKQEIEYADNYFSVHFPDKSKPVICLHPGAAKIQNRWGTDNFIELMVLLYKQYNAYLCLTSGPIDKEITDSIKTGLSDLSVPCEIIEKTSIRNESAIIAKTDLYISNDTGMMHVASYVNANVIGLFGPTKGYEWGPVNERGTFIQSASDDINDITVNEVFRISKIRLQNFKQQ